jgi:hypothetical protein
MSGELAVSTVSREDAERFAERIRLDLESAADRIEAAKSKLRTAIAERHDVALGYASPAAYLAQFKDALARLTPDLRRPVVRELKAVGMSTRAIAPIVGTSFQQVATDATQVSHDPTPDATVNVETGEVIDVEVVPTSTLGLDGKTYRQHPRSRDPTPEPVVTPSGIVVPEGDDPHEYESACHVDPSGGVNRLNGTLADFSRVLTNYYRSPSRSQLNVIAKWLDTQQRKLSKAQEALK